MCTMCLRLHFFSCSPFAVYVQFIFINNTLLNITIKKYCVFLVYAPAHICFLDRVSRQLHVRRNTLYIFNSKFISSLFISYIFPPIFAVYIERDEHEDSHTFCSPYKIYSTAKKCVFSFFHDKIMKFFAVYMFFFVRFKR